MTPKAIFGKYWPGSSIVHKLDPRTKMLGTLFLAAMLFVAANMVSLGFVTIVILAFFMVARIPLGQAFRSISSIAFIALLAMLFNIFFVHDGEMLIDFGWLQVSTGGLYSAIFIGLRLVDLLLLGSLLTMTTTTMDITEAIESLLQPFTKIGLPAHEFAFVMGTALRFLPQFVGEFHTIRQAQISRGAKLATSPLRGLDALTSLITPMFASVFRHADTLSLAMDARCYHGATGRTRLHPLRFRKRDALSALLLALVLTCIIALNIFV